jgi:acetyl-CoA carboxylase carboxyl transferase subunit beta
MRLFSRDKPKIKGESAKAEGFSGWLKCTHCQEMIHVNELSQKNNCCSKCDYHYRLSAAARIDLLTDKGSFVELFENLNPADPLNFVDREPYPQRLERAAKDSGRTEGIYVGEATLEGLRLAVGVLDFDFMAGSMGSVVGEKLTRLIEHAAAESIPLIIVSASGGARMQESVFSLMQMAKTSAALSRLSQQKVPYISILTNPTLGGVTASFAALGDIILAEPHALIGFAGPRVVEQTIRQKLPPGAQQAEFLLKHGMIDAIVSRHDMRAKLSLILSFLKPNPASESGDGLSEQQLSAFFLLTEENIS